MMPIEIFYHLYIPGDWKCVLWTEYIDGHLELMKRSELLESSNFNLCITMPRYWTNMAGLQFTKNNQPNIILNFESKIREYIELRYPFVRILDVRDISEPNIYEGQTLKLLQDCAFQKNAYFLYIHSKGISNFSPAASTTNWKQILDHFIINQWKHHIKELENYDVTGVRDLISCDLVMSGNFWWSKSSYLKTLPNPLNTRVYFEVDPRTERYAFERWVMVNQPKYSYIVDTKTNHYTSYCFLETLIT